MKDVEIIEVHENHVFVDTGSPYHVQLIDDLDQLDVKTEGKMVSHSNPYFEAGSNVNFVRKLCENRFAVRTYERDVEDERLSSATAVVAVALAMNYIGETTSRDVMVETEGGQLNVTFEKCQDGYGNIWLGGEVTQIFKGEVSR